MEHRIRHLSTYSYDPAALRVALRLKLFPVDHEGQQVESWKVTVNDEEVSPLVFSDLGDREALWSSEDALDQLTITAEGIVSTRETNGIVRGMPGFAPPGIYIRETELTEPDEAIRALMGEATGDDTLSRLHALMGLIHERVKYLTGSTSARTTAADALKDGKGVCQDHAQLFIAAARTAEVPARYVTGYLQMEEETEELLETHAWAEAHVDGIGWVGFDPSHNLCPTERYVRLCSGLDAFGASPIRGNVLGETKESLEVSVAIGQSQQ
ncbi:transglutaminase family protein [Parvularcula flava]|uniref:Transglutaminase n=1 Tax=Aquisalinus luteolus TaxID=1566827 RepID=A0A8J3A333_9PROT|nr:transglutaminase family protein [Aquisalinus luteolus]NHK28471.1 transglutaminase family protein [Aquisalinus luteolus]GGH98579.1 transglutaminase [Aquisalinus luteolus]